MLCVFLPYVEVLRYKLTKCAERNVVYRVANSLCLPEIMTDIDVEPSRSASPEKSGNPYVRALRSSKDKTSPKNGKSAHISTIKSLGLLHDLQAGSFIHKMPNLPSLFVCLILSLRIT
jgi:hypothetical protein